MKTSRSFSSVVSLLGAAAFLLSGAGRILASGAAGPGTGGSSAGASSGGAAVGSGGGGHGGGGSAMVSAGGGHAASISSNGGAHFSAGPSLAAPREGESLANNAPRTSAGAYAPRMITSTRSFNPWSGATYGGVNEGAAARSANTANGFAARQLYHDNGATNNRFATGAAFPANGRGNRAGNSWTDGRGNDGRGGYNRHRWYYPFDGYLNPYPIIYGGTYDPGFYGGGEIGSYAAPDADATATYDNTGNPAAPNPNFATTAPAAPPQNPPAAAPGTVPDNGPDSLVEAVQDELTKRGYFTGKTDAMFTPATRDAVRKFQVDHQLASTGLLNEATLHALQLD